MGAHRAAGFLDRRPQLRQHLIWMTTAVAVFVLIASVVVVSRRGRPGDLDTDGSLAIPVVPASERGGPPVAIDPLPVSSQSSPAQSADPSAAEASGSTPGAAETSPPRTSDQVPGPSPRTPAAQPTTSPAARRSATTQPATPAAGLTGDYEVSSSWDGGYVASVVIRNGGTAATDWALEIRLPAGVTVTGTWNANFTLGGSAATGVTIRATPANNPTLAPGASISLGYIVSRTNKSDQPVSCAVSGRSCQ